MELITLTGRVPSKKNSRITTRTGRSFPSKKYTEWHKDASYQLLQQNTLKTQFYASQGHLNLVFYMPDNRKADLTNKAESIMDLLVDNGWLEDDSWQVVPTLTLRFAGVDPKNPRCEVSFLPTPTGHVQN